jgi:hypothetical protein
VPPTYSGQLSWGMDWGRSEPKLGCSGVGVGGGGGGRGLQWSWGEGGGGCGGRLQPRGKRLSHAFDFSNLGTLGKGFEIV